MIEPGPGIPSEVATRVRGQRIAGGFVALVGLFCAAIQVNSAMRHDRLGMGDAVTGEIVAAVCFLVLAVVGLCAIGASVAACRGSAAGARGLRWLRLLGYLAIGVALVSILVLIMFAGSNALLIGMLGVSTWLTIWAQVRQLQGPVGRA